MTFVVLVAAFLAGLFAYSAYQALRAEAAYPPVGSFVEVDGARLHYVERAPAQPTGAPIVLLHGASGNLRDWLESILPALAETHRVIAFDRPGHGWSERPGVPDAHDPAVQARIFRDACRKLGVERPILVGHSWSGAVVTAFARQFPEDVGGIVVLSGATHPWPGGVAWYHRIVQMPVLGSLFVRSLVAPAGRFAVDAGVAGNFAPNPPPADYAKRIGLDLLFRPHNFRHNSFDTGNLKSHLLRQSALYHEIGVPTLIITGNRDHTVSAKIHSYALHAQIAGSELIKLRNVGHMPHHVCGPIVIEAISRLANGGPLRPGLTEIEVAVGS